MRRFDEEAIFEDLCEVFLGDGPHAFRVILNPAIFDSSSGVKISMTCSSGIDVPVCVEKWGRKMRVTFSLLNENCEGVFRVSVSSESPAMEKIRKFWVIR